MTVANVYLIQLNKEYIRKGAIDVDALFNIDEISDKLIELEDAHKVEIVEALAVIRSKTEPTSCLCRYKARKKHCGAFNYLYPDTPIYGVYDLNRIGSSKQLLADMVDQNILALDDIQDVSKFKKMKLWQWQTYTNDEEIIIPEMIHKELNNLEYPLYFLDYETLPSAIPKYDGTWPHQQVIFQYSLQIVTHEGAEPIHREYLHTPDGSPMQAIADNLRKDIGDEGSVIVWFKPFEGPRTKELADYVPEHKNFLLALVDRICDLMDIVTKGYYHHKDFLGSASIKFVLPVMCPDLSYKDLNVQNGTQALNTYRELIFTDKYKGSEDIVVKDLLEYCKLDTWAMVRIWQEMKLKILK